MRMRYIAQITHLSLRAAEGVPFAWAVLKLVVWHPMFYIKQTAHCGWGLFARVNLTFAEVQAALYGFLTPIDEVTFATLRDGGHPSLFASSTQHYILHELLSLVNHQCKSKASCNNHMMHILRTDWHSPQVYFSRVEKPSDAVKKAPTTPAFVVLDDSVRVLRIKSTNPNHRGFLADEEICVNYRQKPVAQCRCRSCSGMGVDAGAGADAKDEADAMPALEEEGEPPEKRLKGPDE